MQILNNFNIHVRFTNVQCTIYLDIVRNVRFACSIKAIQIPIYSD